MPTAASLALDALAYGGALFVVSVGLSVTLGLMRVVNLAHGAFAMAGGYAAAHLAPALGYAPALVLAVAGVALLALPLEAGLFRPLYARPDPLPQVLLTVGLVFVAAGLADLVFGPGIAVIPLPPVLSGPVDLGFRSIAAHRLFAAGCGLAAALGLWLLIERTGFGLRLRATVDDPAMAAALGIRTDRLRAGGFALAAGLGAFGGVVGAELLPIEPSYALRHLVTILVVTCVGGAGSIGGALGAAMLLGAADTLGAYAAPAYAEFGFYAAVLTLVTLFPRGLAARS